MYSISEVLLIQVLCFFIVLNSSGAINYLKQRFPLFFENINELINLYKFICQNNPLLLEFYDYDDDDENENEDNAAEIVEKQKQVTIKFEDKYLERFREFPNKFIFDDSELEEERKEYEKIKLDYENNRLKTIELNKNNLSRINEITEEVIDENYEKDIKEIKDDYWFSINDSVKNKILEYYDMHEMYEDEPEYINFKELYFDLLKDKEVLFKNLKEIEKNVMTEDDLCSKAHDVIINKKLDKCMNNYILEHTPLGNIYMRYNNDKKSFEYFSNNTIPYRYLEPVGRKYVMTYWCKPIFVDIEEELKKAEIKYDSNKEDEKKRQDEIKNNPKDFMVKLKNYNKETKNHATMNQPMKNRSSNNVLPPQIRANLPNVSQNSEKQLLKENANRYTCEGRLTGFCPLKKIDKKILDKKLNMSYAEFKLMQQKITK